MGSDNTFGETNFNPDKKDKNPKHCTYKQRCINQNCLDGFPCEYHKDFIDKTNK